MRTIVTRSRLRRLVANRRGVSAIEFAIIAPVMITLMLGAFDFGNAIQLQVQLQAAVRAGGAYAASYPTDPTGIQNAVTNSLPAGLTLSSTPTVTCKCLNSSTGATSTTVCTAPSCVTDAKIISITATMPYSAITSLFATAIASNSATYIVRYQ